MRHKDRYIGRLYLDIGIVPGEIGHLPMYQEVTGTPREVYGPYWAIRERERGCLGQAARPPRPSPNWTRGRGRVAHPGRPSLSPLGPIKPITSPGGFGNPPALQFSPKSSGTLLVSEYSRQIYQSLCLDHFETPRHVPDLIRDSELLRYIKTHKLII